MRLFVAWLLLSLPCLAQESNRTNFLTSPPTHTLNCKQQEPANAEVLKGKLSGNKGVVNLTEATAFVVSAIDDARCKFYAAASRFILTTADLDFQTLVDTDGTLEVIAIGGAAGELDKQVTSDSDYTYSVPAPDPASVETPIKLDSLAELYSKPKTKPASKTTLSDAIAAAINGMSLGIGNFSNLSQHQVKVSIKFAFTKDGTLELAPKLGPFSITGKFKKTETTTQTLTLTFADQVPLVNLSVSPSSPVTAGTSVTLIANVVPPANTTVQPTGEVRFWDGTKPLGDPQVLKDGFAGVIVPPLKAGVHSFTVVYGSDATYDSTASTPTVMVVEPSLLPTVGEIGAAEHP